MRVFGEAFPGIDQLSAIIYEILVGERCFVLEGFRFGKRIDGARNSRFDQVACKGESVAAVVAAAHKNGDGFSFGIFAENFTDAAEEGLAG